MVNGKSAIRIRTGIVLLLAAAAVLFGEDRTGNGTQSFASRRVFTPDSLRRKLGSGRLEMILDERIAEAENHPAVQSEEGLLVHVYLPAVPTVSQIGTLSRLGVTVYPETWVPPVGNHKWGFLLIRLPPLEAVYRAVLALSFIKRMDSAEGIRTPQNATAAQSIHANLVWEKGSDGSGVKVAILDSGLDTDPVNADLPASFQKWDYSNYPGATDGNVENIAGVTGHGTHVTGTVLGRGVLSAGNVGNGGGAYKGMAPGADLIFLKIGRDSDGAATTAAMNEAMTQAVSTYGADIISMSYGGWGDFNDGSESTEQVVDWCYEQGTAVFLSAGNDANAARHFSGTVPASGQSAFIRVNVTGTVSRTLHFNTVWRDGSSASSALSLHYYSSAEIEIPGVTRYTTTESPRGTESQYSRTNSTVPAGANYYYLKVWNASSSPVDFHIYEYLGSGAVKFPVPDPGYTVGSPAVADHAMAVGAWTSLDVWQAYDNNYYTFSESQDDISSFSSRGPRIDGVQKPEITAPGSVLVSMRDTDYYTTASALWVDNDGQAPWSDAAHSNYVVMQGTSMACPVVAGAAALLLQKTPTFTPQQLYDAITGNAATDAYTNVCPNTTWGFGKLDVNAAYPPQVFVETNLLLEGAYSTSTHEMQTTLRDADLVPSVPPYEEDNDRSVTVPSGITDWVLVQLRSEADGPAVASKSALLRSDGRIVTDDGSRTRITLDAPAGDYYVVVKHRNHAAAMSADPVPFSISSSNFFYFTDDASVAMGVNPMKELEAGVFGLWAGDINQDGQVTTEDYTIWYNSARLGETGYRDADVNLNGQVTTEDYTLWYNDARLGAASGVP
jgi:subtilisin family serine protease